MICEDLDLGSTYHIEQAFVMDVNFTILLIKTCHRISPYSRGEERNVTSDGKSSKVTLQKSMYTRRCDF